jgi:hypothetical protein
MNEQIKDLREQATEFNELTLGMWLNPEKFAELIVRECLNIVEQDLSANKVKAENDNEGRIWVNAQLTFSELIKSRFGIEK